MELGLKREDVFIPKFNGNQDLQGDEQIQVIYRIPTESDRRILMTRPQMKFLYDSDGKVQGGETTITHDDKAAIDRLLISIKNLYWKDEKGKQYQVMDNKSLWEAPVQFHPLVVEIGEFLREKLDEKLPEKN